MSSKNKSNGDLCLRLLGVHKKATSLNRNLTKTYQGDMGME